MTTDKSYVSIEQKVCPACGKNFDSGSILLDRTLSKSMNGKTVTGFEICNECNKPNYVLLVGIDSNKSTFSPNRNINIENAYRTGEIIHIKKDVADKLFNIEIKTPMLYVDEYVVKFFKNKL